MITRTSLKKIEEIGECNQTRNCRRKPFTAFFICLKDFRFRIVMRVSITTLVLVACYLVRARKRRPMPHKNMGGSRGMPSLAKKFGLSSSCAQAVPPRAMPGAKSMMANGRKTITHSQNQSDAFSTSEGP